MYTKLIGLAFLCILLGAGCSELPKDQQMDYENDIKPLVAESAGKSSVRGSCNMIEADSHCIDYRGSLWSESQMKLNCQGGGVFSLDGCPYSENGGCLSGEGTVAETVFWSYDQGNNPISGEQLQYEVKACNAVLASKWVKPEDLLKK